MDEIGNLELEEVVNYLLIIKQEDKINKLKDELKKNKMSFG